LLTNLRQRFERFCFRNRDKGIPNLMLYIVLGNALVMIMSMMNGGTVLYTALCFDKDRILQGQVWRLITYVFTQSSGGFLELIFLYFFYMLGRMVENSMGTFKFNLYYFAGVILMDVFAMIFCPLIPDSAITMEEYTNFIRIRSTYMQMAYYLHLSLILLFATTHPDSQFLIFFIIPIKAWIMAVVYLVLTAIEVYNLSYPTMLFPHNLFPWVALANYFLFVGKDITNLLPMAWRMKFRTKSPKKPKVVQFRGADTHKAPSAKRADYNHRCEVCGRTDVSNPELEFRYCSRCAGYRCYCEDHINDHTHE